jgi:hypothetical protein
LNEVYAKGKLPEYDEVGDKEYAEYLTHQWLPSVLRAVKISRRDSNHKPPYVSITGGRCEDEKIPDVIDEENVKDCSYDTVWLMRHRQRMMRYVRNKFSWQRSASLLDQKIIEILRLQT